jgi:transcriptional regulator with XRE-family HTH domain
MAKSATDRTLGEFLRDARVAADLSLRDLAKQLDVSPSYLSDIENDRRVPAEDVLRALAEHLTLDADTLLAMAGRFGEETERYMKKHPAAGILFRKISSKNLSDDALQKLLETADELGRNRGRGR